MLINTVISFIQIITFLIQTIYQLHQCNFKNTKKMLENIYIMKILDAILLFEKCVNSHLYGI